MLLVHPLFSLLSFFLFCCWRNSHEIEGAVQSFLLFTCKPSACLTVLSRRVRAVSCQPQRPVFATAFCPPSSSSSSPSAGFRPDCTTWTTIKHLPVRHTQSLGVGFRKPGPYHPPHDHHHPRSRLLLYYLGRCMRLSPLSINLSKLGLELVFALSSLSTVESPGPTNIPHLFNLLLPPHPGPF